MSSYWQGKGAGKRIAIRFNKPLVGDVAGNETAFTVKGMVRSPLKYGPLTERTFTVESVERYPLTVFWEDDFSGQMNGTEVGENGVVIEGEEDTDYSTPVGYFVALVTADKTHRAATYIRDVLQAKGHTVTLFNRTEVTSSNLSGHDAIITPRLDNNATTNEYLRNYINAGIPVWIGQLQGSSSDTITAHPAVGCGMVGMVSLQNSRQGSYVLDAGNPVTGLIENPPQQINIYSTDTWMDYALRASGYVGTPLANYGSAIDGITALAIEKGTNDLSSNPYGARCGYIGWMYSVSTVTLTAEAQAILDRCIRWSLAAMVYLDSGTYTTTTPADTLPTNPRLRFDTDTPEGTSITVEYAASASDTTPPETWTEVNDGDLLTVDGDFLWLRYTLETEDTAATPTLLSAWLEEPTAPPGTILLTMAPDSRFNDVEGDLTVSYERAKGTLTGTRPVEDFTESFTPTDLEPTPIDRHDITAGIEVAVDLIKVDYIDLGHKNTITAGITVDVALIPVSAIPP